MFLKARPGREFNIDPPGKLLNERHCRVCPLVSAKNFYITLAGIMVRNGLVFGRPARQWARIVRFGGNIVR